MRLAIHQPNFFPWVGLFHKIACVDSFMFFDHVQAPNGKSWLSRNRILLNGKRDQDDDSEEAAYDQQIHKTPHSKAREETYSRQDQPQRCV